MSYEAKFMSYELYIRQTGVDALSSSQHAHDDKIEIVQILSGSGRILIGDNFCAYRSGDVFVIDTGVIHCTSPDVPNEYVRNKVLFDRSMLVSLIGEIPLSLTAFFSPSDFDKITESFDRLGEMLATGQPQLKICAEILLLLEDCLSHKPEHFISDNSISARTIAYINEHLFSDLSLDALSSEMHISKFHLSRIFKSETGMTLGGYTQTARLNYAKKRLIFSDDSVSELAQLLGFNDPAAFSKSFSSKTGVSPITYRKRMRLKS